MRLRFLALAVAALVCAPCIVGTGSASADGYPYPPDGWPYGSPEFLNRIGQVLNAIDNPSRRSELAETWVRLAEKAVSKNIEFHQQWLDIQAQQLAQAQQAQQQNMELAQLQLQIEQLRAENLKLERENMQMRTGQSRRPAAGQMSGGAVAQEPNQPAR